MKKKRNYIALSRQHARIDLQVPRETWKRVNILCSPGFQRPRHQEDCSEVVEVAPNKQSIKIIWHLVILNELSRCKKKAFNLTCVNLDLTIGHYPKRALFQRHSIWFCFTSPKSNKISDWNHIECNPWINFTPVLSGAQWQPEATLGEVRPFTIIGFPYHKLSQEECRWARLFNRGWCTLSTHKVLPKSEISLRNFPQSQSHHRKGYHNYHIYLE